ncbi:peroxiredoxin family protein [bacterium]|nr:peroxiredoxin family protein [bacterium]
MTKGSACRVFAFAGAVLALASCASKQKVDSLETKVAERESAAALDSAVTIRWHDSTLERLAAIERREEFMRIELARLEKWQRRQREKDQPADKPADKPADEPARAPDSVPLDPAAAAEGMYKRPGIAWSPFERAVASKLAEMYVSGKRDEELLKNRDEAGVTLAPRDPGKTGADGETLVGKALARTRFLSSAGETIDLKEYIGKKNVVLVVLRGFDGAVCVACTGQTLAISQKLDAFEKKNAEVFLVYPGKAETVPKFLDAVRDLQGTASSLPVEMLLDVDLAVVHDFKIEGRLAKPTTVIVDKKGVVRFAHVGQSKTDRPTVPQMLEVLARLEGEGK